MSGKSSEVAFNFRDLERWVGNEKRVTRLSYYKEHQDYESFRDEATKYIFGLSDLNKSIPTHERYHIFVTSLFDFFLQNFKRGFGKRLTKTEWETKALEEQIETSKGHFDKLFGKQQTPGVERNVDKYLKRAFNQCLAAEKAASRSQTKSWRQDKMRKRWMELISLKHNPKNQKIWNELDMARHSFKNMEVAYNTMLYDELRVGYSDFYDFKSMLENNDDGRSEEGDREYVADNFFPEDYVGTEVNRKGDEPSGYTEYKEKLTEKLTDDELKAGDDNHTQLISTRGAQVLSGRIRPPPIEFSKSGDGGKSSTKGGDKRKSRKRTRRRRRRKKYSKKSNRKLKKKSRKRKRKKRTRRRRRRKR